jgi:hypothetical protein
MDGDTMGWSGWWTLAPELVIIELDILGVYELGDESKNTVYYGNGKLETRLQDHLNKKDCPLARKYRTESFPTEAQCKAREEELLRDYQKTHGRFPMYNEQIG